MIVKIVEQIKTGNIKNVYRFGQDFNPNPSYVVVRKEVDGLGRGIIFRIFVHMLPGQDLFLDDYCDTELDTLLDGFSATDRHGNYNELEILQDWVETVTNTKDGTIFKERRYLMPSKIF